MTECCCKASVTQAEAEYEASGCNLFDKYMCMISLGQQSSVTVLNESLVSTFLTSSDATHGILSTLHLQTFGVSLKYLNMRYDTVYCKILVAASFTDSCTNRISHQEHEALKGHWQNVKERHESFYLSASKMTEKRG